MESDICYKEVYFGDYCNKCQFEKSSEDPDTDSPCVECLETPARLYSHKPLNFKEKEK